MFGFLKDKLKKAVAAFSKSAESEVKEEKVEDKKEIEKALQQEKKKPISKKEPVKVEKKPEPKKKEVKVEPKTQSKVEKPEVKVEKESKAKQVEKKPEKIEKKETKQVERPEKIEKKVEQIEEAEPEKAEVTQKPEKKGFFQKLFGKKKPETPQVIEEIDEKIEEAEEDIREDKAIEEHIEVVAQEPEEKPGFLGKIKEAFTKKTLTPEKFDELFWELELAMLENNVAVEVIEKIKTDLKDELTSGKVSRTGIEDMITSRLRQSIEELFEIETFDLIERIKENKKPYKICIIGVNGSGKTTTLAKIIHMLQKNNLSVVVAASDTFRAAAIDQLKEHTDRLNVKLISQGYGADPAAVSFDAIKHAEAKNIDVVLIDTAGRLHSNTNLMQELEKVIRVANPDLKIFVGESITGNDCVEQAKVFNNLVGIDAIILSKADIDEKGGAAISVSYITGKPILYLGTGQTYDDLEEFDKEKIVASLELE